ncbi:MAG TPA: hypothetical protein VF874_00235 [Mycobacterium sp.]
MTTRVPSPETAHRRSRLGGVVRYYGPDHPKVDEARRDLEVSKLADHVAKVLACWPPPTDEQLDRIAALLRTGTRGRVMPESRKAPAFTRGPIIRHGCGHRNGHRRHGGRR